MLKHLRTIPPFITGLIVASVGIFFSEWLGLYDYIPHFDKVLHVSGGIVAAWFVLALLQNEVVPMTAWKQVLIIIGIAALIGVVWELAEYAGNFTRTSYPVFYHYFHGGNLADTLIDLVCDISGAFLLALWALWKERK